MYFKPRIFISSTMGDKLKLRSQIKNYFEKAGAEVALYEKDLTPSTDPNTYRNDILQTDFVIFIIDERYGAKTDWGISGTEEEFIIAQSNNKPCHVYLKQIDKTDESEKFEALIKSKGISYYFYKDENDLLRKLKSTCFTIARDIVKKNIDKQQIEPALIRRMSINHDINMAKPFCEIMDLAIDINNKTTFTFVYSNLMLEALDYTAHSILSESKPIFIDGKLNDMLVNLCQQIIAFIQKMVLESVSGTNYTPIKYSHGILNLSFPQWNANADFNWYNTKVQMILQLYADYKNYLAKLLLEGELSAV